MPRSISEKRITYAACGRCGRAYCTGDHKSCPECHGRRRSAFAGSPMIGPAIFDDEGQANLRVPFR